MIVAFLDSLQRPSKQTGNLTTTKPHWTSTRGEAHLADTSSFTWTHSVQVEATRADLVAADEPSWTQGSYFSSRTRTLIPQTRWLLLLH